MIISIQVVLSQLAEDMDLIKTLLTNLMIKYSKTKVELIMNHIQKVQIEREKEKMC